MIVHRGTDKAVKRFGKGPVSWDLDYSGLITIKIAIPCQLRFDNRGTQVPTVFCLSTVLPTGSI